MSSSENPGSSHQTETVVEIREETSATPQDAAIPTELLGADPSATEDPEAALPELPAEHSESPSNGEGVPEMQIELPNVTAEPAEAAEIDTMLAGMEKLAAVPQGKVVKGKVLKVTEVEVRVNVGTGLEGVIPLSEFLALDGQSTTVAPGDEVGVWVERYNEKEGTVTVSRQKAARLEVWEKIEHAFRDKKAVNGRVMDRIKGGLTVDIGVLAFMPSSQADLRPLRNVDSLLGQEITCKIIKLIRKRSNVVVSRKEAMEEDANQRKAALLEHLQEGVELTGRVKNLTDYGAFVDLGGMDGLLHVTDMSWGRIARPSEVVQAGQEIKVKVLKFDAEKGRVSLGLKQLQPDPWERVATSYHAGDRITGRIANVTDYGAFVELEPGIEGLVHVSEMSWSKRPKHPSKIVKHGECTEVAVLGIDAAQRRISLSLKQTLPDPWGSIAEKFTPNTTVDATVTSLTDFGAFAEVDSDIEGLVRNADLSWTKKVKHPSEVLKKGQKIKAMVLSVDAEHRRLALGLKQLEPDPWEGFCVRAHIGDMVKAKVARMAPFGAFVEIEEGIEGLCHTSEFGDKKGSESKGKLEIGSEHEFRVIRLDPAERKISLSLKPATAPPPQPKSSKRAENAPGKSGFTASPAESKKKSESTTTTTMAEALSAAGITPRRSVPEVSVPVAKAPKTAAPLEEPTTAAPLLKAEPESVVAVEPPAPSISAASDSEPVAAVEVTAPPVPSVHTEEEKPSAAETSNPVVNAEEKAAVAGEGDRS
jgi:small subunit ribosomal protein S1